MEDKVKEVNLDIQPYKATGTYVLKGTDDIQLLLDEQLNALMMMKASPYIIPVKKSAE